MQKFNFKKITSKKLTRLEFLSYTGIMVLTLFGITSFLKNLAELEIKKTKKLSRSFGSGPYGI